MGVLAPDLAVPATIVALAAARIAGVNDHMTLAKLSAAMSGVASSFQIRADIASIQRDALSARMTYPIAVICRAADLPAQPVPAPHTVIGAMLVTGSLEKLLAEATSYLTTARESASDLSLLTLCAYIDDLASPAARRGTTILVSPEPAPLAKAIDMAEAFLDADPSYCESWETHREGMFGAELVVSRYPAALIIEIQRRAGRAMDDEVDDILDYLDATAFRYYDHVDSDIDTDTLGIYLRLAGRHAGEGRRTPNLVRALDCLTETVASIGQVPVWLVSCGQDVPARSITLGEGCGTVAAHLLLGLAELTDESARATLTTGARSLLARIRDVGLGANVDYPPMFAAAVFFRLLDRLAECADGEPLRLIDETRSRLMGDLESFAGSPARSAQEAALMVGACRAAGRIDLVAATHLATILKHQRFDGGWPAETFAMAPNRGQHASPYSSSTLTSALCYAALVTATERRESVEDVLVAQGRA
ncbi:MAG TPA: hypothetical protein VH371_00645 [Candidatus Limnocylindrales bacterium]